MENLLFALPSYRLLKQLVECLLKAGSSIQACENHQTEWQCFAQYGGWRFESGFGSKLMKRLIEVGADVTRGDDDVRSPLCHVIT